MSAAQPISETLAAHTRAYANTAAGNDAVFSHFTAQTLANPLLWRHRQYIEAHQLGFGDRAFHHLWLLILTAAAEKFPKARCLEIGVFKGQVISLWSLLSAQLGLPLEITAISPLRGNPLIASRFWRSLRQRFDRRFRENLANGNFYPEEDYEGAIRRLFAAFDLNLAKVRLVRGFSNAPAPLDALRQDAFEVVYVDGDHSYEGVVSDLENYGPKIVPGGWMVVDDASFYLPGSAFWKGHEAVSRACRRLDSLGFANVLNVGHNRVFQRVG